MHFPQGIQNQPSPKHWLVATGSYEFPGLYHNPRLHHWWLQRAMCQRTAIAGPKKEFSVLTDQSFAFSHLQQPGFCNFSPRCWGHLFCSCSWFGEGFHRWPSRYHSHQFHYIRSACCLCLSGGREKGLRSLNNFYFPNLLFHSATTLQYCLPC